MKIPEGHKIAADYERNGVVVVRGMLSDGEVRSLRAALRLRDGPLACS